MKEENDMRFIKVIPSILVALMLTVTSGCFSISRLEPTLIQATATMNISTSISMTTTNTPTSISMSTSAQIPTKLPVAPLSPSDAVARVNGYLTNTANCRLPCWLGITPRQSTLADIQTQLALLTGISTDTSFGIPTKDWSVASITIPYPSDNMVTEIRSAYLTNLGDNKIYVIEFFTRAYKLENGNYVGDIYGYPVYNALLKSYTISGILTSFGQPDQIYVTANLRGDTLVTPGVGDYFELHVWYPHQGIFLVYQMSIERSGENYRVCPANALISGSLLPPGLGAGFQDILLKLGSTYQDFFPPTKSVKKLEDTFSITDQEFYTLFHSPTDRCLETPIPAWWPK
jgi:small basic protein